MSIDFSKIAERLHDRITNKLSIWDAKTLAGSSKSGKALTEKVQDSTMMVVNEIYVDKGDICFSAFRPDGKRFESTWEELRKKETVPRFSVGRLIIWKHASLEALTQLGNEARFVNNKVRMIWDGQGLSALAIFDKITEIFTIVEFTFDHSGKNNMFDTELLYHPTFQKIESLLYPVDILPDHVFLELKATTIMVTNLASHPAIGNSVNLYLQQWVKNEREIDDFYVECDNEDPSMKPEALFKNIEIADVRRADEGKVHGYESKQIYVVERNDKKRLEINIMSGALHVKLQKNGSGKNSE